MLSVELSETVGFGEPMVVMGQVCRTIVSGEQTGGTLAIVHVSGSKADGVPTHTHVEQDEVFQVISGRVQITVGDTTTTLGPGESAIGPRNVAHAWVALEDFEMVVSVTPSGLEEMFAEVNRRNLVDPRDVVEVCKKYDIHFA